MVVPTDPKVLRIPEDAPGPEALSRALRSMSDDALIGLYWRTCDEAAACKKADDLPELMDLVRGTRTIKRIAAERGLEIGARR